MSPTYYTPEQLLYTLEDWGLQTTTIHHEPLFTVEESSYLVDVLPGAHCKSLFLKNKKKQFYLVVMQKSYQLDIVALSSLLGGGRLSFCTAEQLYEKLGVMPGSVSPFGLINPTSHDVNLVLEKNMMDHDILNYHPLINTMTTSIRSLDMKVFLNKIEKNPLVIDLPIKPNI